MTYKNELYGQFVFADQTINESQTFTYSTSKPVRDNVDSLLNPPTIKSAHADLNRDGLPERWNITMRIRKPMLSLNGPADLQ